MKRHRYRQAALPLPGAEARNYSPAPQQLAGPKQGWLALDGAALGPLFNTNTNTTEPADGQPQP